MNFPLTPKNILTIMKKIEGFLYQYDDGTEVFEPKEKQEGGTICPNIILVKNDRSHIKATTRSFIMHLNIPRNALGQAPRAFISNCNTLLQDLCAKKDAVQKKLEGFDKENEVAPTDFDPVKDAFGY